MKLLYQTFIIILFCCYGSYLNAQDATITFTNIEDNTCGGDGFFGGNPDIAIRINGSIVLQDNNVNGSNHGATDEEGCTGSSSFVLSGAAGNNAFSITIEIWDDDNGFGCRVIPLSLMEIMQALTPPLMPPSFLQEIPL